MYAIHVVTVNGDIDFELNDPVGTALVAYLKDWNTGPFKNLLNSHNVDEQDIIEFQIFKDGVFHFCGGKF